jgi:hypothetical protein
MSVLRLYYTSPIRPLFTHKSCTLRPFPCEFGRFFFGINQHHRDPARSRKDRSERGRHHAKGTRYVSELGFLRFICPPLVSSRPFQRHFTLTSHSHSLRSHTHNLITISLPVVSYWLCQRARAELLPDTSESVTPLRAQRAARREPGSSLRKYRAWNCGRTRAPRCSRG